MNNLTVHGGKELMQSANYSLFEMFIDSNIRYYMCLPSSYQEEYQVVIDFPEEYYKALLKTERISEIMKVCDTLYQVKFNAIYILPNITTYDLSIYKAENDDHAYQNLINQLHIYTYNAFNALKENDGIVFSQKICLISQTDDDKKLMNWLEINMPGYFESFDYAALSNQIVNNDNDGWTSLGGPTNGGTSMEQTNNLAKPKVKKLVPPSKHGFLNITFIIVVINLSLIIGIGLALILVK